MFIFIFFLINILFQRGQLRTLLNFWLHFSKNNSSCSRTKSVSFSLWVGSLTDVSTVWSPGESWVLGPSCSEQSGDPGLRPKQPYRGHRVRDTPAAVHPGVGRHIPLMTFNSLTACTHRVQGLPSVSALKFNGSLTMAVGTSTGQVKQS